MFGSKEISTQDSNNNILSNNGDQQQQAQRYIPPQIIIIDNNIINDREDELLFSELFPKKKQSKLQDIPTIGKVFLLCVFLELLVTFSVLVIRLAKWDGLNDNFKFSVLALLCSFFLFFYAFDSIYHENKFQLFSFIIMVSVISLAGIYQFYKSILMYHDITSWLRFTSALFFIPLNVTLAYFSYKRFGWRLYKKIGTSIELRRLYKTYEVFLSLLKIDIFINSLMIGCFFFFYQQYYIEFYINFIILALNIIWVFSGKISIQEESRVLFFIFIFTSWIVPCFDSWKIATIIELMVTKSNDWDNGIPVMIFAFVSFLNRVLLILYSTKAYNNFGKGLKIVFQKSKMSGTSREL
ncbi:hypothetical protein CYY_002661 [Polysphondylium violaceum]|uniref:DUF7789 domain-containing protein n=1 Tax=Polysphondylium violaceum TaxID=133409 RepID=A0A8J4Q0W9_9MYCE|nr:hypothetical protein CYY_002661 [Polysphondylium violaceum]